MVKAVINGERVECGACGALLSKIINKGVLDALDKEFYIHLEIKCKHKANGKTCNEVNKILL
jgi:hypothetical protein